MSLDEEIKLRTVGRRFRPSRNRAGENQPGFRAAAFMIRWSSWGAVSGTGIFAYQNWAEIWSGAGNGIIWRLTIAGVLAVASGLYLGGAILSVLCDCHDELKRRASGD